MTECITLLHAHTHSVMITVLTLCVLSVVVVSISGNNFLMIGHTQDAIITVPVCVLCNMYCMRLAWDVCTFVLYMSFIGCVYTVLHVYCTQALSLYQQLLASLYTSTCAVHTGGVLGAVRGQIHCTMWLCCIVSLF